LAVGSLSATSSGKFSLEVHIESKPAPATNTTCSSAMALAGPATVTFQDANLGNSVSSCRGSGKNLFYSINVPSGYTLQAVMSPVTGYDAAIRLVAGSCPASGCIASQDSGNPETLVWKNTGADQIVVIAMGPYGTAPNGAFDATIDLIAPPPPPANAACASATMVMNGTMLANESTDLATTSLGAVCLSGATGKQLFYALTLAPGETLTATATPTGNWDPVLRLLDACTATTCTAQGDGLGAGVAEKLAYTNPDSAPKSFILGVGSYDSATPGAFKLAIDIH
jgi:hypothetical protein